MNKTIRIPAAQIKAGDLLRLGTPLLEADYNGGLVGFSTAVRQSGGRPNQPISWFADRSVLKYYPVGSPDPITGKTEFRREEFGLPRVGDLVQFDWDVEGVSIGCFTATVEVAFNDGSNTVVVPLDQKVEVVRDMSRLIARESSR